MKTTWTASTKADSLAFAGWSRDLTTLDDALDALRQCGLGRLSGVDAVRDRRHVDQGPLRLDLVEAFGGRDLHLAEVLGLHINVDMEDGFPEYFVLRRSLEQAEMN